VSCHICVLIRDGLVLSVRPVPDLDPRRIALLAAVVLAVVVIGVRGMGGGGSGAPPAATLPVQPTAVPGTAGGQVTVHVAGAVAHPGVYRLRRGERVDDAVRRAGGPARRADLSAVNLAAVVEDGRQVLVPTRAPAGSAPGATPAKVNLNTATPEQLDTLAGVGPATAAKILAFREQHGGFGSVEELGDVPGIGDVRLEALRDLVTV
jgi:competence protein ComEA